MDIFEAIETRRAVKHYDAEHKMTAEEERRLFELAIQAPTAFNLQHWRFVCVKDPAVRAQIRENAWDQAQVTDASLLIVLCGKISSWEDEPARFWKDAPQDVQDILVPAIDGYYRDKPSVQRDEVFRSCGIVAQTIMLAARGLGYDSCPMDGFDFDKVGEIIKLPQDHAITMMIAVGKRTKDPWPKPGQLALEDLIITDAF